MGKLLFGFRHVTGVPTCPCRDPGNYLSGEEDENNPLLVHFQCWCGRKNVGTFDSVEEKQTFLKQHCGVT